jgi:hypothetical protein
MSNGLQIVAEATGSLILPSASIAATPRCRQTYSFRLCRVAERLFNLGQLTVNVFERHQQICRGCNAKGPFNGGLKARILPATKLGRRWIEHVFKRFDGHSRHQQMADPAPEDDLFCEYVFDEMLERLPTSDMFIGPHSSDNDGEQREDHANDLKATHVNNPTIAKL